MDCSTLHRHQETMSSQSLDSMIMCTKPENEQQQQEKKPRPSDDQALKCPRCDSSNTKFCYYNNYSLSQPRYFCKSCRRYWTKGGTLRNVPVGGGCRKNRRSSSSSSSSSSSKKSIPDHHLQVPLTYDHHTGLTLAHGNISILGNHGNPQFDLFDNNPSGNSFLDTLRSGLIESSHNLYYGNLGHFENGGSLNLSHENQHDFAMQFDGNNNYNHNYNNNSELMSNPSSGSSTPTGVKQEMGENRILWGFPWQQINGDGWNSAIIGSSWNNNLLNSPLM